MTAARGSGRSALLVTAAIALALGGCHRPPPPPPPISETGKLAQARAAMPASCEKRRAAFDAGGGRIVGGDPARPGSAPWQVEILSSPQYTEQDRAFDAGLAKGDECKLYLAERKTYELSHKCGASYIGGGFVLTAAHCVDNIPGFGGKEGNVLTDRRVRLGTQNLTQEDGFFAIDAVVVHRGYGTDRHLDDIALIRVRPDARIAQFIAAGRLAAIAPMRRRDRAFDKDEPLRVTGWGWMGYRANDSNVTRLDSDRQLQRTPAALQELAVAFVPDATCAADYPDNYGPGTICAGALADDGTVAIRKDSCQGDSGGPLTRAGDRPGDSRTLAGVVSSGRGCGAGTPGLYTRVALYEAWIAAAKTAAKSGEVVRVAQPGA